MASIEQGSRLVVRAGDVAVTVRALRGVDLTRNSWAIPVIADLDRLQAAGLPGAPAVVDLTSSAGTIETEVEMVCTAGDLMLRSKPRKPSRSIRPAALADQRRQDVRGPVQLEFRGTVLDQDPVRPAGSRRRTPGLIAAAGPGQDTVADLAGVTVSVSAGGVRVRLEEDFDIPCAGAAIYGEITLPAGDLVPAMMTVREATADGFRAGFSDISPLDSERLVRLVFHRERIDLRERRGARVDPFPSK